MAPLDCDCARFSHEHPPDAVCGMTLDWLFEGQEVALGRWRCLIREPGWSEEKAQLYHVISFVHEGGFVIRDSAGSTVAEPSAAVVFYPGAPYQTAHPFGCSDHGSAIAVRSDLFREIAPEAEGCTSAWTASIGSQAFLAHRLRVRRFLHGGQREEMSVLEEALLTVDEVTKRIRHRRNDQRSAAEQRRRRERTEAVKSLLLQKLEEPVRLADIAESVGTSIFYLCRCFREETGLPIHRYLQRLRLRAALASAIQDRSDLGEIALRFSFSSHSHFTAAFRQEFGLSPSAARLLGNA